MATINSIFTLSIFPADSFLPILTHHCWYTMASLPVLTYQFNRKRLVPSEITEIHLHQELHGLNLHNHQQTPIPLLAFSQLCWGGVVDSVFLLPLILDLGIWSIAFFACFNATLLLTSKPEKLVSRTFQHHVMGGIDILLFGLVRYSRNIVLPLYFFLTLSPLKICFAILIL